MNSDIFYVSKQHRQPTFFLFLQHFFSSIFYLFLPYLCVFFAGCKCLKKKLNDYEKIPAKQSKIIYLHKWNVAYQPRFEICPSISWRLFHFYLAAFSLFLTRGIIVHGTVHAHHYKFTAGIIRWDNRAFRWHKFFFFWTFFYALWQLKLLLHLL